MTNMTNTMNHGNLVAGASAEGYGALVGWARGAGDMTRGRLVEIAKSSRVVPDSWLPRVKEAGPQLTLAVREACGVAYNAERVAKSTWNAEIEPREWSSRWLMVTRATSGAGVGDSFGTVALVATLYGDSLEIETANPILAEAVRRGFDERIAAERYVAADVTKWLAGVIRDRLDGVRLGGAWYVTRANRAAAEALCDAFRLSGWGSGWFSPALPIATSAQLSLGLANGLSEEAGEIAAEIRKAREEATAAGKLHVGERAAQTFLTRIRYVGERVAKYADILGDAVRDCYVAFCDAMIELDGAIPGLNPEAEWKAFDAAA